MRTTVAIACILLLPYANSPALAQSYAQFPAQGAAQGVQPQLLSPDQLDNVVAPIALYPDPLLSQVLAACTYPLEIVEAEQWLQQNRNLQGRSLIEAAKRQNWDPSVQLLVAFPDVMALFSRDIRWTTDLGNAFLAQQADVMNAIQRLRARASANGRLTTTPQQIVSTETQGQQSAIQIQPANPQVVYPPVYNPASIWGPPATRTYPAVYYPQASYPAQSSYAPQGDYYTQGGYDPQGGYYPQDGYGAQGGYYPRGGYPQGGYGSQGGYPPGGYYPQDGYGSQGGYGSGSGGGSGLGNILGSALGFGNGINLGGLFSGLLGWGGWGWVLSWFTHSLSLNGLFFSSIFGSHNYGGGFNSGGGYGGGYGAPMIWAHNPAHRLGVPYSNGFLSARYRGVDSGAHLSSPRFATSSFAGSGFASSNRSAGDWHGFQSGNRMTESFNRAPSYRSGFASNSGGFQQNYRGYSSGNYSSATPQRMASGFRSDIPFNRSPAPARHFEAPRAAQQFSPQSYSSRQKSSMPRASAPHFSSSHFSAPRGSSHFSAPRNWGGGGHSGKGSGGGHSGKGSRKR